MVWMKPFRSPNARRRVRPLRRQSSSSVAGGGVPWRWMWPSAVGSAAGSVATRLSSMRAGRYHAASHGSRRGTTMTASERANLPRWRGDAGFVEIWFLVVFHPPTESALWLRYTTFAPAPGAPGAARAIVWAAWFDARAGEPAVAVKAIHPTNAYDAGQPGRFGIRIGSCVLEQGYVAGAVAGGGRRLVWDLTFIPAERPAESGPWLLRQLPLPVRVSRPNADTVFCGTISVDGVVRRLEASPGLQTHIWGTRHVESSRGSTAPPSRRTRARGSKPPRLASTGRSSAPSPGHGSHPSCGEAPRATWR